LPNLCRTLALLCVAVSSGQSIVNEVLAKKPKRRVEWVPFTHHLGVIRSFVEGLEG
jgi:hypothetical protein